VASTPVTPIAYRLADATPETHPGVLTVIDQLQPSLIVPMHIDTLQQALTFVQNTAGRYAVRQVPERFLTLSRQLLPAAATLVLFGGS
jgi:hypothetical protein